MQKSWRVYFGNEFKTIFNYREAVKLYDEDLKATALTREDGTTIYCRA
jgi:hypothetical protein